MEAEPSITMMDAEPSTPTMQEESIFHTMGRESIFHTMEREPFFPTMETESVSSEMEEESQPPEGLTSRIPIFMMIRIMIIGAHGIYQTAYRIVTKTQWEDGREIEDVYTYVGDERIDIRIVPINIRPINIRALLARQEDREMISMNLDIAPGTSELLAGSQNLLIRSTMRERVQQDFASRYNILAQARTLCTAVGVPRLNALTMLHFILCPIGPRYEYSYGGIAYFDIHWRPEILKTLCGSRVMPVVISDLMCCLDHLITEDDSDPTTGPDTLKEALFCLSFLIHYYYGAADTAAPRIIDWMIRYRYLCTMNHGLSIWMAPRKKNKFPEPGSLVESMRTKVGLNAMMIGDLRQPLSHDASLVRIIRVMLTVKGAREKMACGGLCSSLYRVERLIYIEDHPGAWQAAESSMTGRIPYNGRICRVKTAWVGYHYVCDDDQD